MAQQVNYIATEHLLIGIILEEEEAGGRVLAQAGITAEKVWAAIAQMSGSTQGNAPDFSQVQSAPGDGNRRKGQQYAGIGQGQPGFDPFCRRTGWIR